LKYQQSQIPGLASQISWVLRNRLWQFLSFSAVQAV
jgi:hypothetical protein